MLAGVLLLLLMVFLVICSGTLTYLATRIDVKGTRLTTVVTCSCVVLGLVIFSFGILSLPGQGLSEIDLLLTCLLLVSVLLASHTLSETLRIALKLHRVIPRLGKS